MGPQDPKDVNRDTARDLSALVGELAALMGDATHWLTDPEYAALRLRLEAAHAAAEAALVEACRRVRLNEGRANKHILALAEATPASVRGAASRWASLPLRVTQPVLTGPRPPAQIAGQHHSGRHHSDQQRSSWNQIKQPHTGRHCTG